MVACKTVGEYKRNQEKIKKFCLEEAKQQKVTKATPPTGGHKNQQTNPRNTRQRAQPTNWSPAKVRQVASQNSVNNNKRLKARQHSRNRIGQNRAIPKNDRELQKPTQEKHSSNFRK